MGRALILETSFLVDLEREHLRGAPSGAIDYLASHDGARLYLPAIVVGELAAGSSLASRPRWFRLARAVSFFKTDTGWEVGPGALRRSAPRPAARPFVHPQETSVTLRHGASI